jgi:ATP synthase protein I
MSLDSNRMQRMLRYSSVGIELGAAVLIGLWVGQWLDGKFGTTPWLLLVGLGIGMAAGFRSVFRLLKSSMGGGKPPNSSPPQS